jgi:AraC-like DNA-binding protein
VHDGDLDKLRKRAAGNPVVARLQDAARELLGGVLLVLVRRGDEVLEIHPAADDDELPEFCRLYRSTPGGMDCCRTCRSLMTFGACYRGSIQYACHGGVIIIASSAHRVLDDDARPVIASCAFTRPDKENGWREFRDHARGLGLDLRKLRAAYDRMPVLTDERRRIAFALVETTAAAIDQLPGPAEAGGASRPDESAERGEGAADLDNMIRSALYMAQAQSADHHEEVPARLLVGQIQEMVRRNPTLPFTLRAIAGAARVSPNYLSTVFHQYAGATFSDFLLQQRIARAKRLLRDLTLSVGEVARRSGFPDASYFTRRFRQRTGTTPTRWRGGV